MNECQCSWERQVLRMGRASYLISALSVKEVSVAPLCAVCSQRSEFKHILEFNKYLNSILHSTSIY